MSGRTYPNKPSPVKADSRAQTQIGQQPLKKVSPSAYSHDFSQEYLGKKVEMTVASNITVEGVIEKASKYWFKVNSGGEVIYVNKAWVIAIKQLSP